VTEALDTRRAAVVAQQEAHAFEGLDVTLPGVGFPVGALHPITQLMDRATAIFPQDGVCLGRRPGH